MKILTPPQSGSMPPSGIINSYGVGLSPIGSISTIISVTADVAPVDVSMFTSSGGVFLFASAITLFGGPSSAGIFNAYISRTWDGVFSQVSGGALDIFAPVGNSSFASSTFFADSGTDVFWSYDVTGFSAPNSSVYLRINIYKLV